MAVELVDFDGDYGALFRILVAAGEQASLGKGIERHSALGETFRDQQIIRIQEWTGSTGFAVGQAVKKALESTRMTNELAIVELRGAIVYLAAAIYKLELEEEGSL